MFTKGQGLANMWAKRIINSNGKLTIDDVPDLFNLRQAVHDTLQDLAQQEV